MSLPLLVVVVTAAVSESHTAQLSSPGNNVDNVVLDKNNDGDRCGVTAEVSSSAHAVEICSFTCLMRHCVHKIIRGIFYDS